MAWVCHRFKPGRKTKGNSGQAYWKRGSSGKSELEYYWTTKSKLDKKRHTDWDWGRVIEIKAMKGKDTEAEWGLDEYEVVCKGNFCFVLFFNFMISLIIGSLTSNDKIQDVSLGVVLQLRSELQKIRSPGTKKPGSWALKSSNKTEKSGSRGR